MEALIALLLLAGGIFLPCAKGAAPAFWTDEFHQQLIPPAGISFPLIPTNDIFAPVPFT